MNFNTFDVLNLRESKNMQVLNLIHGLLEQFEVDTKGVLLEDAGIWNQSEDLTGFYLKLRTAQGSDFVPGSNEVIRQIGSFFIDRFSDRKGDYIKDPHDVFSGKWAGTVTFIVYF